MQSGTQRELRGLGGRLCVAFFASFERAFPRRRD